MRELTCSVDGCEGVKPKLKLGMCGMHYQRLTKYGSTDLPQRTWRMCDGPQCSRRAGASGLCRSHYKQQHLGKPLAPLQVWSHDLGRPPVCIFPDCGRPHKARGYCKSHNEQAKKAESLRPVESKRLVVGQVCSESGCTQPVIARGLCAKDLQYSYQVVRRYGLTLDQYEAMLAAQGGVCAICGGVNANGYRLAIDHNHTCCPGQRSCGRCVRALLCGNCNLMIGQSGDDAKRLRAGADYLERSSM